MLHIHLGLILAHSVLQVCVNSFEVSCQISSTGHRCQRYYGRVSNIILLLMIARSGIRVQCYIEGHQTSHTQEACKACLSAKDAFVLLLCNSDVFFVASHRNFTASNEGKPADAFARSRQCAAVNSMHCMSQPPYKAFIVFSHHYQVL